MFELVGKSISTNQKPQIVKKKHLKKMVALGPSVQNIDFSPSNYMTIDSGEKILKRIIDFDVYYDLPMVFGAGVVLFIIRMSLIHGLFKVLFLIF